MAKKHSLIDLFCGAGGFSAGFEMEDFESILAIDKWDDAVETYNYNRKNKVAVSIDIHDYGNDEIRALLKDKELDGIIGGPPCQGFSTAGKRETGDSRNSLYLEYVRFVDVARPKFFILENVKGLLTMEHGLYRDDIMKRFSELGYNMNYKVLRASDYGVPQARERVFFIGLRKNAFGDRKFDFDDIEKAETVSCGDALSDLPSLDNGEAPDRYRTEPSNEFQKLMRGDCTVVTNNEITRHTQKTIDIISKIKDGGDIRDLPEEYFKVRNFKSAFKRMDSALPSATIDCGHQNYFHYSENRNPTVRESARIQSFPDCYYFTGKKGSQLAQVGNAVPVLLAKAIAKVIRSYLEKMEETSL